MFDGRCQVLKWRDRVLVDAVLLEDESLTVNLWITNEDWKTETTPKLGGL